MNPQIRQGNRRHEMPSEQPWSFSMSSSRELIGEHPVSSTLLAFGMGLGVGVLIGQTIAGALMQESHPSTRLESLSQQVCDAVRNAIPEAISRHLPH